VPRIVLPPHAPGMRIGLFGGTFDPPHEAHFSASLLAMKRLDLDRVWWLVTPGNPLKDTRGLAPLAQRIVAAGALARHPRIDISSLEAQIGTTYTYETIAYLRRHCPGVRFVWIMGADNLRSFHRWQRWRGRSQPLCQRQPGRPRVLARAHPGNGGEVSPLPQTAGLGLPPWAQIAAVVDGLARRPS